MVIGSQPAAGPVTFRRAKSGKIISTDRENIRLALEALGVSITFTATESGDRHVMMDGVGKPHIRLIATSRRLYKQRSERYRLKMDRVRMRILNEFGFHPSRIHVESTLDLIARSAEVKPLSRVRLFVTVEEEPDT